MKKIVFIIALALGALYACKSNKTASTTTASSQTPEESKPAEVDECTGITPTYTADISVVMAQYCTKCHQGDRAPAGADLTKFGAVKNLANSGKLECVVTRGDGCKAMPPMGKIAPDDLQKLLCWIKNNSPE